MVYRLRMRVSLILVLVLSFSFQVQSYETDQYSYMDRELKDAKPVLDKLVNEGIAFMARNWKGKKDPYKFAVRIARLFSSRQLERWVNSSGKVEGVNDKTKSVYRTTGFFNSPIIRMKGLASTINLDGVHVGADKMSHFFGVGGILYRIAEGRHGDKPDVVALAKALNHSRFTEISYWGELTTNVFSNADLVVNYEGYQFLRSLYEDEIVDGKKAIIKWEGDRPVVQRPFTFSDHVNDYWSEALNPNWYQWTIAPRVRDVLRTYCVAPLYKDNPSRFVSKNDEELNKRYSELLEFRSKALKFRLDQVCNEFLAWPLDKRKEFLTKQYERMSRFEEKLKGTNVNSDAGVPLEDLTKSAIPTCHQKLTKAKNEHQYLVSFYNDYVVANDSSVPQESYIDKNGRSCTKYPISFEGKGFRYRKKMNLDLYSCSVGQETEVYYEVNMGSMNRFSLNGLHGLKDTKAYMFRTVPMLCRWY